MKGICSSLDRVSAPQLEAQPSVEKKKRKSWLSFFKVVVRTVVNA